MSFQHIQGDNDKNYYLLFIPKTLETSQKRILGENRYVIFFGSGIRSLWTDFEKQK